MKELIIEHKKRYPKMQVQDIVKLLYQSEFGNGHMITDGSGTLRYLEQEYQQLQYNLAGDLPISPSVEAIGGGFCRIYLDQLPDGLTLKTLNQIFMESAGTAKADKNRFEGKLEQLKQWSKDGITGFTQEEIMVYLEEYKKTGYQAVSHSGVYRGTYQPAYRVIAEKYAKFLPVFADIDRILTTSDTDPVLVAIDGQCASGKTMFGRMLQQIYDCNLYHMDDFFLQPWQRTPKRLNEVGGNVDYERFRSDVLEPLTKKLPFDYLVYDCSKQALTEEIHVPVKRLQIIEGAYSQHPYFGSPYHLTYCLLIDGEEQRRRILKRNGAEMLKRFEDEWIPKENAYLKQFDINSKFL